MNEKQNKKNHYYIEKGNYGYGRTNKTRDKNKEKFMDYTNEFAINNGNDFFLFEDNFGEVKYFKEEKNLLKYIKNIDEMY